MRKRVRVESQAASATAAHVADDAADADSLWHCDSAYALVGLAPGRSIFIHGRCTAWLTGGRVSIAGATLSAADGAVDLYVPLTRAALCIACPDDEDARPASELALPDAHAADCGNRRVGAVLVMVPLNSDAEATPLTRRLFGPSHGAQWLRVSRSPEDARERFPPSWAALVHSHADAAVDGPPVLLVCGRRGVGKSSLVRFAVNTLLSRDGVESVTLVDTDPGQPEVGPPGTVSLVSVTRPLLCPSFCVPPGGPLSEALSLLVVGTAPDAAPLFYEKAVLRLAALVRARPSDAMVINTPGWITGLGLEALRNAVAAFAPNLVVQVMDGDADSLSFEDANVRVETLASQVRADTRTPHTANAAQSRDAALSCHLGCEYEQQPAMVELPLSRVCVALHDAHAVPDDLVLAAVYQTLVALVASPSFAQRAGTYCPELPDDGVCIGFGIVRTISDSGESLTVQCSAAVAARARLINVVARAAHALPPALANTDGAYTTAASQVGGGLGSHVMTGSKWIARGRASNVAAE